jgi:hypothetical protein
MATAFASAPEQGQLVSVRSRNWIVNEVVPGSMPTTGLQGVSDPQTLISLASVVLKEDQRKRRNSNQQNTFDPIQASSRPGHQATMVT